MIVPPSGELFSETNDNSVAILLTHGTIHVLLAGDTKAREKEDRRAARTRGLKGPSRFETTKQPELRFRALLTEGDAKRLELARA